MTGVVSLLISLLCYITMWNSPADVGGTSNVSNGENKSDDQGLNADGIKNYHGLITDELCKK